jgi:hypothetical protein
LKSLGYNVKYRWESDWNQFRRGIHLHPHIQAI